MAKPLSHKQRAIDLLAERGWVVVDTEHHAYGRTFDLLGFCDLLAFHESEQLTLFLQVTSVSRGFASNVNARVKKILAEPLAYSCVRGMNQLEVWGVRDVPDKHGGMILAKWFSAGVGKLLVLDGSLVLNDSTIEQLEGV